MVISQGLHWCCSGVKHRKLEAVRGRDLGGKFDTSVIIPLLTPNQTSSYFPEESSSITYLPGAHLKRINPMKTSSLRRCA